MSKIIVGHCGKCGAPYYSEYIYFSIIPPTPQPSCTCWNLPTTTISSGTIPNETSFQITVPTSEKERSDD